MKQLVAVGLAVFMSVCFVQNTYAQDQLTAAVCKQKAQEAAKLLEAEGEAALAKIKDPNGSFMFAGGQGYIWVHNLDGIMVMHPIKPALDGQGLLEMRDSNGRYLFNAMNELVEAKGEGWVTYVWPKPGEEASSPKASYVVLAKSGDVSYVAGCGLYDVTLDDIKRDFPGDNVYED